MVRTRSSRRLEASAETEQLPVLEKVSTRRRGKKQTARDTVVDARKTPEPAAEQAGCLSHVHTNVPEEARDAGAVMVTDHNAAIVSIDATSEQAAFPDVPPHSPARDGGEIDFSVEAAQLAEAILDAPETEQTSEPSAPTVEQHQRNSEFAPAHPDVESLPVPSDAGRGQAIGVPAEMELQEERGIPNTSALEMSAGAPPGGASDDSPPDQQEESSSDHTRANGDLEIVCNIRVGIQEGLEPVEVQPAANACPHSRHDSADDSINDDLASGRADAVARDATTTTLLQKRSSMRSGSLEAYERGATPASPHCSIAFANNQDRMALFIHPFKTGTWGTTVGMIVLGGHSGRLRMR